MAVGGKMNKAIGKALVAGAGLSGIRSALDLAQTGYKVLLIDTSDHVGGLLCQLDYQFPTSKCGYCRMLPMFDRDLSSQHCLRKGLVHENIEILLSTELISIEGEPGNFSATLKQNPSLIDPALCTGCGECEKVCQVFANDPFNEGLIKRKAVYLPSPQSFSNAYTIDYTACTRCGDCEKICPTGAIRFIDQDREKFKILVVDDEKIVRESTKEWLQEEGFSVTTADSGQRALDLMDAQPFNMMLTDIKMPGMDGVQLLAKAKQINPELCVIMMTAYAAVDSAVDAMKQGALDYLTKPFDPDMLVAMVLKVYHEFEIAQGRVEQVDALILAGGVEFFKPNLGKNPYGYGVLPGVITGIEFERLISGTGPGNGPGKGKLMHPVTGKPVEKIAWIQCVGSRDAQTDTPFCSTVCCMMSIKEAVLAREKFGPDIEATLFYMDMRTLGKSFEDYKSRAQNEHKVRFVRARIHSLTQGTKQEGATQEGATQEDAIQEDLRQGNTPLVARYADLQGKIHDEEFDLVVLATGQKPNRQMTAFGVKHDIAINPWGFIQNTAFSMVETSRPGILSGGAVSGLKDISDSVTCASAAALGTCKIMHQAGKQTTTAIVTDDGQDPNLFARQTPKVLTVLCRCGDTLAQRVDLEALKIRLGKNPENESVEVIDKLCMAQGREALIEMISAKPFNRLVLGACLPCIQKKWIQELARDSKFPSSLVEILDMISVLKQYPESQPPGSQPREISIPETSISDATRLESTISKATKAIERELKILISRARLKNPIPDEWIDANQNALIIGGGIAGITAALSIADCGFHVDLVEKEETIGGNLRWMDKTIDALDVQGYLADKIKQLAAHKLVTLHTQTRVESVAKRPGEFATVLKPQENLPKTVQHGVTILATGGSQAPLELNGNDSQKIELTQKGFEIALQDQSIDPERLTSVVMIQCSGTRDEKMNYCSRVCCVRSLKNAIFLKEKNPDIQVYVLYRDMMSYGFFEDYYTQAKNLGVLFFQYDPGDKPVTRIKDGRCFVKTRDLLLDMPVEIEADYVVHATGILPDLSQDLVAQYGAALDQFHFFKEADSKFRPVDSMNYRVFGCGLSLKPCTIQEAVTSAEASAIRAVQILSHERPKSGKTVAATRSATCSLCEMCVETCPYGARFVDYLEGKILLDPAACQGCGVCGAVCPSNSAFLEGFDGRGMLDAIDMAMS
jgi:heterodisulfide reductase subunit A